MDCMLVDVIKLTLASCDYTKCSSLCYEYLMNVGLDCPNVFSNQEYADLWRTLWSICAESNSHYLK